MFLVHNERTKLTATWLNSLATALVGAGVFAPAAALLYGLSSLPLQPGFIAAVLLACMGLGVFLHWIARTLLGGMRE
jgi:hypothetical protein